MTLSAKAGLELSKALEEQRSLELKCVKQRRLEALRRLGSPEGMPKITHPEYDRLQSMRKSVIQKNTTTVWIYNSKSLIRLLHTMLLLLPENDYWVFPPMNDQICITTAVQIFGDYWEHDYNVSEKHLCVVLLNETVRNPVVSESLDYFTLARRRVYGQITLFVYEGTRKDFDATFGCVHSFKDSESVQVFDWNLKDDVKKRKISRGFLDV